MKYTATEYEEMVKALNYCNNTEKDCGECPYVRTDLCKVFMSKDLLIEIINYYRNLR